ncbi:hypothetical protein BDV95DRAFT_498310 [Massariosphaeria phaeospora]|uniref:Uncharacterized protein n=1 Tax=Massariosphaeria phaeospora TaxID=100035 RepID=A0A7C8MKK3_9PLEO|nr:hypothetical protein BDV95DRAFT_498310 [Massariosphaeria phaeospora]
MYITSELFGSDPRHTQYDSPNTTPSWSTMTDLPGNSGLGKRKRRADAEEGPSSSSQQRCSPSGRQLLRLHGTSPVSLDNNAPRPAASTTCFASERRPVKQLKRMNPKPSLPSRSSQLMDIDPGPPPLSPSANANADATAVPTALPTDLRPCHACKSAPKRRRDLENYSDCKRCAERTCYICTRQCSGVCGKLICQTCIVEVGEEGDSWCLDCYARHIINT